MKILFIFEFAFPPYRSFLIREISRLASKLSVVSGDDRFGLANPFGVAVLPRLFAYGDNILYFLSPLRIIRSDVIFTTFNLRRPHTWLYVLLFPYKKWIFWGQGFWSAEGFFARLFRVVLLRMSSGYIVYTPEGRSNLIRFGYPSSKISVAYNTIDVPNASLTFGSDYFLYVGRLQERKRLDIAIRALKGTHSNLRIVGDGPVLSSLRELVHELDLESQVEFFPGTFDDFVLKSYFSNAIAYVSPGHVGLGVVHAFAYGVPVITISSFKHAPEFSYCSVSNSYLCNDAARFTGLLHAFEAQGSEHLLKRREAFQFFDSNLRVERMLSCFTGYL